MWDKAFQVILARCELCQPKTRTNSIECAALNLVLKRAMFRQKHLTIVVGHFKLMVNISESKPYLIFKLLQLHQIFCINLVFWYSAHWRLSLFLVHSAFHVWCKAFLANARATSDPEIFFSEGFAIVCTLLYNSSTEMIADKFVKALLLILKKKRNRSQHLIDESHHNHRSKIRSFKSCHNLAVAANCYSKSSWVFAMLVI